MTQINQLIELATSQVGYMENPKNSNLTKYGDEYGINGVPWCVIFIWWLFKSCGLSELFCNNMKIASCTEMKDIYFTSGHWITNGDYKPGDIVILSFNSKKQIQHCGLIIEKISSSSYRTIEGNTSSNVFGIQDNGGCVAIKKRNLNNIVGVCRPNYTVNDEEDEDMTNEKFAEMMDIYLKNLAEKDIPSWAKYEFDEAVAAGITDGTRPLQFVPRYQAAIMALRASKRANEK